MFEESPETSPPVSVLHVLNFVLFIFRLHPETMLYMIQSILAIYDQIGSSYHSWIKYYSIDFRGALETTPSHQGCRFPKTQVGEGTKKISQDTLQVMEGDSGVKMVSKLTRTQ